MKEKVSVSLETQGRVKMTMTSERGSLAFHVETEEDLRPVPIIVPRPILPQSLVTRDEVED